MSVVFGDNISEIYYGEDPISKIYWGNDLVYQKDNSGGSGVQSILSQSYNHKNGGIARDIIYTYDGWKSYGIYTIGGVNFEGWEILSIDICSDFPMNQIIVGREQISTGFTYRIYTDNGWQSSTRVAMPASGFDYYSIPTVRICDTDPSVWTAVADGYDYDGWGRVRVLSSGYNASYDHYYYGNILEISASNPQFQVIKVDDAESASSYLWYTNNNWRGVTNSDIGDQVISHKMAYVDDAIQLQTMNNNIRYRTSFGTQAWRNVNISGCRHCDIFKMDPAIQFVTSPNQLYYTTNMWQSRSQSSLANITTIKIFFSRTNPNTMFALGTSPQAILKSTDSGVTWNSCFVLPQNLNSQTLQNYGVQDYTIA